MDKAQNKYIAVTYKLYTVENGKKELVEEATTDRPFQFISGFGITLDAFEAKVAGLAKDETFSFELTKDEAYGDVDPAHVLDLDARCSVSTVISTTSIYLRTLLFHCRTKMAITSSDGCLIWTTRK